VYRETVKSVTATVSGEGQSVAQRAPDDIVLRPPRAGELGWIVHRHGVLYAAEYGWDMSFEAKVAEILGELAGRLDLTREQILVAERDGNILGSATLVARADHVAQLRLVYVEPSARGLGLGRHLVEACLGFARACGYQRVTLWTNDPLVAARRLYAALGFERVSAEPVVAFGKSMVSETWSLDLVP
jgi:N-acetylglutamate synthase-like GNAT family acetyltransferase